jgi:hypothetical protein
MVYVILRKRKNPAAAAELFMKTAQQYLSYTVDLGGRNIFGQKVGYDAQPWAGAFIDVCAKDAGLQLPSFVYTPAALAEFLREGNFSREARPGAIAIYNFSSNVGAAASAFSMPHCGIVIDVREFQETGRFVTVEGNTEGAGAYQKKDGVYQKVRSINDVVVFCHPKFEGPQRRVTFNEWLMKLLDRGRTTFDGSDMAELEAAAKARVKLLTNGEIKHGDRNKRVETIQLALATVTDLRGCEPGKWDSVTAAACSRYQRVLGFVGKDVTGLPDVRTLNRLAQQTGLFRIDA